MPPTVISFLSATLPRTNCPVIIVGSMEAETTWRGRYPKKDAVPVAKKVTIKETIIMTDKATSTSKILSAVFDNGDPRKSPYPINKMCMALDTVLIKAPTCTESPLYRRHRKNDVIDFCKGEIRTFPYYLTTSTNYCNQPCHQLIIMPNLDHTKAKALYKIRNDKEEYQVNFKRGSSFLIEKVETFEEEGIEYKRIWMKEL